MNVVLNYASDFFSLFFPELCPACGRGLVKNESVVCTECRFHLPYTNSHLQPDNPIARQFWGRFPFEYAMAYLYFYQNSKVQKLIHQLKYNHKPEVGHWLGQTYGNQIRDFIRIDPPDIIVPVPLHKSRERKRGYNQSERIASGLSTVLGIPVDSESLLRNLATSTQTKKSRFFRSENMMSAFSIVRPENLQGKHLLIVDDVITTGATVEACALTLLSIPGVRISIAAIAFTM
ncbi:ComF family protein [Arcticibacter tournemirensis]